MNTHRIAEDAAAADPLERSWEGTVRRLTSTDEGGHRVVRFVLETEARSLPVEMRGDELRGVLGEGDQVRLADAPVRNGTVLATHVDNVTTGARVEMWRPSSRVRMARLGLALAKTAATAVVTGLVGVLIGAIFVARKSGAQGPHGGEPGTSDGDVVAFAVIFGLSLAVALAALYLWHRSRGRKAPVALLIGAAIGAVAAALLVTLAL